MKSIDIARLAGVSRSTVSRVVNGYSNVPEETRKKVLEVIEKYNYVPQSSARMLAGYINRTIGLFLVDTRIRSYEHKVSDSFFLKSLTSAVIDNASTAGYNILTSMIGTCEDYKKIKDVFLAKEISGGIINSTKDKMPVLEELADLGFKMVIINLKQRDNKAGFLDKCIVVNTDNFNGGYQATDYLIKLGHTKIAHICGDMEDLSGIERFKGYKKALQNAGLPFNKSLVVKGNFLEFSGYKAAKKLLAQEKPTAIFSANDSMVIGAMQAIYEENLKIPDDISVIGFDDIEMAPYLKTPLTTIRMDLHQIADLAMSNLIKSIENKSNFSAQYLVPVQLIERESCRAL